MQVWAKECRLHVGAEAVVDAGLWLGLSAIRKERRPRTWRHPDLDKRLTKSRMNTEARMLQRLTIAGLPVPQLLALDMESGWMVQERRPGRPLIEWLRDPAAASSIPEMLTAAGTAIRNLHAQGAAHGDLTTNNLLWDQPSGISLIDFGLGRWTTEMERFGLDLQVLHECLSASHPEHADAMDQVILGYSSADAAGVVDHAAEQLPSAAEILSRFEKIRTRVRYHG
tara:strand:- start:206 stop:883 length:678 start_codon:yes stop_codon:yes gene_type:complete